MNWYKLLKLAQSSRYEYKGPRLYGEYWIDEHGSAHSVEGYGHDRYVAMAVRASYSLDDESMGIDIQNDLSNFIDSRWIDIVNYYQQLEILTPEQSSIAIGNPQAEIKPGTTYRDYIIYNFTGTEAFLMSGATSEEAEIGTGRGDARLYAMKEWGWKRLADMDVETATVSSKDLMTIASGLYSAHGDDCEKASFNIYVYSSRKWYNTVPYADISSGNVMSLRDKMDITLI